VHFDSRTTETSQPEPQVRRPLLRRNPHIEQLSKALRKAEEQNVALKEDIARAHSKVENLRIFHDKWSQHDLEALFKTAEKCGKEESAIRIKAEEDHEEVHKLEKKLPTLDESHRALKTERDGTSSMAFKK